MKSKSPKTSIRVSGIVKESIVDGKGIRYVIFSQGCTHNCEDCHNPATHDLFAGDFKDIIDIAEETKKNPLLKGVTFSGGEPFLQAEAFYNLAKLLKKTSLDIIIYTGFTWEQIQSSKNEYKIKLFGISDYVVDGKFEKDKKTDLIPFVGSSNQRIIDVKATLASNKIITAKF